MNKLLNLCPEKQNYFVKIFLIFFIGCIVGWIYEEFFYFFTENIIENRGFLYGPYLPVYGVGTVFIYILLNKYKKYPLVIFLGSLLITGVVEYITGYLLFLIYNRRWWDYTGLFMNIDGFVCLRSIISFAIGALILIYLILPLIDMFIKRINSNKLNKICNGIFLLMIIDLFITLLIRY